MKRNSCKRYRESLCLLASGDLPESERREINAHLAKCAQCRQYFSELRSVATPLANSVKGFADIEPGEQFQRRWEKAILSASETKTDCLPARKFGVKEIWS